MGLGVGAYILGLGKKRPWEELVAEHNPEDECPVPAPAINPAGAATQRSSESPPDDPCFASSSDELRLKDERGVVVVAIALRNLQLALGSQNTVSRIEPWNGLK